MPVMNDPHAGLDMSAAPMMPTANDELSDKITWSVPAGWTQQGASQMRLATLRLADDPQAFDCSIVSLPGGAGGLEANLKRWMAQINLDVPDEQLAQFIKNSSDYVFDFSLLQVNADPSAKSMIAAMIDLQGATIFVKLTGSMAAVSKNKESFLELSKSVRLK